MLVKPEEAGIYGKRNGFFLERRMRALNPEVDKMVLGYAGSIKTYLDEGVLLVEELDDPEGPAEGEILVREIVTGMTFHLEQKRE